MIRYLKVVILGMIVLSLPQRGMTQEVTDYLILEDIAPYKLKRESREFADGKVRSITPYKILNGTAGILNAAGHFVYDHNDVTYQTVYLGGGPNLSAPKVQVTQHSGSDSDKWLLHELEKGYRKDKDLNATYVSPNPLRDVDGNKIWYTWGYYRWVSSKVVVSIQFTDLSGTKPEPLEIVKAYLAKFPSSITLTDADAKSKSHSTTWVKDEMDRRLWLADKWVAQITADDPKLYDKLDDVVKHLKVFLNYKEKYFGISEEEKAAGITAKSEQKALNIYLQQKDTDSIKKKLTAYKTWWAAHKGDAINLQ